MHCDIPLTFVKIVIILWKIWRRKHPHWNSEVDFAFYMYQERKLRFKYEMFRYETLKPLVSLTEVYESRLLSRNISYDQVLVSQKSHKRQFINSYRDVIDVQVFHILFQEKKDCFTRRPYSAILLTHDIFPSRKKKDSKHLDTLTPAPWCGHYPTHGHKHITRAVW